MGRPPYAVAFLYPDNSVVVLRGDDEDSAFPGFIARLEFTIPFKDVIVNGEPIVDESPWPDVVSLGTKKIRDRIGILPDGRSGSRGTCRSCGTEVIFVRLPSGKVPPFDLDGLSHFETCPDAPKWRTSTGRAA